MSDLNNTWKPEDGPPPTEEEMADAQALARALEAPKRKPSDAGVAELVNVALRVRATAHPDTTAIEQASHRAVDHALHWATSAFSVRRWRWAAVAACAVAVLGVGVGGLETATHQRPQRTSFSRPATDVFTAAVPLGAGSMPADRIYDSRLHDYRGVLLSGGRL